MSDILVLTQFCACKYVAYAIWHFTFSPLSHSDCKLIMLYFSFLHVLIHLFVCRTQSSNQIWWLPSRFQRQVCAPGL